MRFEMGGKADQPVRKFILYCPGGACRLTPRKGPASSVGTLQNRAATDSGPGLDFSKNSSLALWNSCLSLKAEVWPRWQLWGRVQNKASETLSLNIFPLNTAELTGPGS